MSLDDGGTVSDVRSDDLAASCIYVAHNVAHIFIGSCYDDLHNRFKQSGACLLAGFLECHAAADLKRHFGRVYLVVRAVYKRYLHIYDLIAGEHTRLHCALDALIDTGDILLGDSAAGDLVDKLIALAGLVGLNSDLTMCKLALTARLTGIAGIDGRLTRDGLLIGNLRLADISLDLELAQKSVNDDLKMKLAPYRRLWVWPDSSSV